MGNLCFENMTAKVCGPSKILITTPNWHHGTQRSQDGMSWHGLFDLVLTHLSHNSCAFLEWLAMRQAQLMHSIPATPYVTYMQAVNESSREETGKEKIQYVIAVHLLAHTPTFYSA